MIVPRPRNAVPPHAVSLDTVLLVEGDSPAHFFQALAKELGLEARIEIRNYGGITELAKFLATLASTTEFRSKVKSLGITRDAEEDPKAANDSIIYAISNAKIPDRIKVKAAIIPDESGPGMLETLCLRSVSNKSVFECVKNFMDCVAEKGCCAPKLLARDKYLAHVYLATGPELVHHVGIAAYKKIWPFNDTCFDTLSRFLRELCDHS